MAKFGNKQLKRVFKRAKTIPGQCFQTENYYFSERKYNIDFVKNINDAASCQDECQKHVKCDFWTYNSNTKNCLRQTANAANAPETSATGTHCFKCTYGPRHCAIGK